MQLQPVVQFCGTTRYPSWARGWQTAWNRAGLRETPIVWPEVLPVDHTAALFVPVPAGRVGPAIGRHPLPRAWPLLAHASLPGDVGAPDLALNQLVHWIDNRPPDVALQLAPPVLEYTRGARVERRELETYGQSWPLRTADGI